jgi:Xaa-Pro aminopeptidase
MTPVEPLAAGEHARRLAATRTEMERQDVDALVVGPSTDLRYLTGFDVKPSERLTVLVLPRDGAPRLVMPEFELPTAAHLPDLVERVGWKDGEDASAVACGLFPSGEGRPPRVAFSAQLHARFLVGLLDAGLRAELVDGDLVLAPVRVRKSPFEIDALRRASGVADRVVEELAAHGFRGASERDVVRTIQELLAAHGNEPVGSGLAAFGENSASPHHHPSERILAAGDTVILDFGGASDGYRADLTRMFQFGEPDPEVRRMHAIVDEANQLAFEAVRPGVTAAEIDAVARRHIDDSGLGEHFTHRTGHGVGLDVHEPPYIVAGNETPLEPGMAFTIEPGVYFEGRFGVRVEDVFLVTDDGAERLNTSSHAIRVVD